eukprot:6188126-Pleurochrysis_carterae.AAC.8
MGIPDSVRLEGAHKQSHVRVGAPRHWSSSGYRQINSRMHRATTGFSAHLRFGSISIDFKWHAELTVRVAACTLARICCTQDWFVVAARSRTSSEHMTNRLTACS